MTDPDRARPAPGLLRRLLLALGGLSLLVAPQAAARIALVVGVDSYAHLLDLANATHDARTVAAR